jgi:2-amino-4-hydroxy-6-hydroxymethyldihydropteridine diphosphokinase
VPEAVPSQAIVALGGNLGDRAATLGAALAALTRLPGTRLLAVSPAYDSDPVGPAGQPDYLNLCAALETGLGPRELLEAGLAIERGLGRVRSAKDGPRTCDIDLLFHEAAPRVDEPGLTLPHPRWRERGFVTAPLGELLQMGEVALRPGWDGIRAEVARLAPRTVGLRPWTGPTPWTTLLP